MALEESTDTTTEDTGLRAALESAFDQSTEGTLPDTHPGPESAPEQPPASPGTEVPTENLPAEQQPPGEEVTPKPESTTAEAAVDPDPIPERVKDKIGQQWAALPPEAKAVIREYESNIGRLASKYGQGAKRLETIERTVAPYQEMIRAEGGTVEGAISNLMETARILRVGTPEQKTMAVRGIIEQFRVDLSPPEGQGASPELLTRLQALERNHLTSAAQAEYDERQRVQADFDTFLADPANVYLKEPGFMAAMGELIAGGRVADLKSAYAEAAWLVPSARAKEIAKSTTAATQARAQQAQAARRAAVSVNGQSPGPVTRDVGKMSLRETLEAAYDGELSQ